MASKAEHDVEPTEDRPTPDGETAGTSTEELTDEQLEAIAGGGGATIPDKNPIGE